MGSGVGLASGVQALGLALVLTLVFHGVILSLFWTRCGNAYADIGTAGDPILFTCLAASASIDSLRSVRGSSSASSRMAR